MTGETQILANENAEDSVAAVATAVRGHRCRDFYEEEEERGLSCIPYPWRPLYRAPARLRYDPLRLDFVAAVREMLECPEGMSLGQLHRVERPPDYDPCPPLRKGMLLAGFKLLPEKKGAKSRNRNQKDWYQTPAYNRFCELYRRLLREEVLPELACHAVAARSGEGEACDMEGVVQSSPVLRVVMPSRHFATKMHRDADYGHISEELNYWVPLTPVWGSNSLYAETFPGREDFAPFEGDAGHMFRWWGNRCGHYAEANATDGTRVSFDFRVVPRPLWDSAKASSRVDEAALERTSVHHGDLRVGSYYALERADTASADAAAPDIATPCCAAAAA